MSQASTHASLAQVFAEFEVNGLRTFFSRTRSNSNKDRWRIQLLTESPHGSLSQDELSAIQSSAEALSSCVRLEQGWKLNRDALIRVDNMLIDLKSGADPRGDVDSAWSELVAELPEPAKSWWSSYVIAAGLTNERVESCPSTTWFVEFVSALDELSLMEVKTWLVVVLFRQAAALAIRTQRGSLDPMEIAIAAMPEAAARLYAERHVDPGRVIAAVRLADSVRNTIALMVTRFPWLDPATRAELSSAIRDIEIDIGPRSMAHALEPTLESDKLLENLIRLARHERLLNGKVDDKSSLLATSVNLTFHRRLNSVTIPIVMLFDPFFSIESGPASFGSLGALVGHEVAHLFDGATDSITKTWPKKDRDSLQRLLSRVAERYEGLALPGAEHIRIDGTRVATEAFADIVGLNGAYSACFEGISPSVGEREEFLQGWARMWRFAATRSYLLRTSGSYIHPPAMHRVNVAAGLIGWVDLLEVQDGETAPALAVGPILDGVRKV